MTRTLLWRDMRALSKDLCETLSADHGKQDVSLSYCLDVVGKLNQRFEIPEERPPEMPIGRPGEPFVIGTSSVPEGSILLGHTQPRGLLRKKQLIHLTPCGALEQILVIGCTGSGKTETLSTLAINAAQAKKGVFYMDGKGDNSLYAKTMGRMNSVDRIADLRVINLMTGGRDIDASKKVSHSLDLFDGMDWKALSEWMQQIGYRSKNEDEQKISEQVLFELCPLVSRLVFHYAIQTGKHITPGLLCTALTHAGIREMVSALNEEDKARHQTLLKATQDSFGLECTVLSLFGAHLAPLTNTWGHVFNSSTPEVGLSSSFKEGHFVLVLGPAMERMPEHLMIIGRAITASLYHAIASRPASSSFDHLAIVDEFTYFVKDSAMADFSRLRHQGVGLVWGTEEAPKHAQMKRWGDWRAPGTHIAMKQCSDHFNADYYKWQALKHPTLNLDPINAQSLNRLIEGEGIIYSGSQLHSVVLDYKPHKAIGKLFMPHVNPLELRELSMPGPMARKVKPLAQRDRDKQAIALFGRMAEFDENNLGRGYPPKLSWCQETLARMMGFAHWHEAQVRCAPDKEQRTE